MTVGISPPDATTVNLTIGTLLRQYNTMKETVARYQKWLAANDLKIAPYNMLAADEANLKTAIANLNTALAAIDSTFIDRCTGLA